jgi:Mrp family chromosome partitioning ATPase
MSEGRATKATLTRFAGSFKAEFQDLFYGITSKLGTEQALAIQFAESQFSEGVSCISLSFGLFLASRYGPRNVVVVEGNLRTPSFDMIFNHHFNMGVSDLLQSGAHVDEAIVWFKDPGISILPASSRDTGADVLLSQTGQENLVDLVAQLKQGFRYVIFDSPPISGYMDGCVISTTMDGLIFVVESNRTGSDMVKRSLDKLRSSGANILGIVFNKRESHLPKFLSGPGL